VDLGKATAIVAKDHSFIIEKCLFLEHCPQKAQDVEKSSIVNAPIF